MLRKGGYLPHTPLVFTHFGDETMAGELDNDANKVDDNDINNTLLTNGKAVQVVNLIQLHLHDC